METLISWEPKSPDLSGEYQISFLKQTDSNSLHINIDKTYKFNIFPYFRFVINNFKTNLRSYHLLCIKAYQKNCDLFVKHPFVCYKHPLSEYTSAG